MKKPNDVADGEGLPVLYENLSFLSETSSIGLVITEPDGTIVAVNQMVRDMLGIGPEEKQLGNVSTLYTNPADRRRLFRAIADAGSVRDFEVKLKQPGDGLRTVLANVDSINWKGRPMLMTSLFDVTQYKQQQARTENSYQTLFSNAPVGITVTDQDGNLIIANKAVAQLLGYAEEDLARLRAPDLYVDVKDRGRLLALVKKQGVVRDFETVMRHRNGRPITVLVNMDVIEFGDRDGMLLTSIRDISDYKRVEEELIHERDFSSTILNIAAVLVVVLNGDGRIARFNHACERLSGYGFRDVEGRFLWDIPFFDPPLTREEIENLLRDGHIDTYDTKIVSRSGRKFTVSWTFAAMQGRRDRVEFIVATGIDVTEKQKAEAALQEANRELASRVTELQNRSQEMKQLNELGEQLQSCHTAEEVCAISIQYVRRICPESHGALYLIDEEKNLAQAAGLWGEPPRTLETFEPLECWAIRRGHQHLVEARRPGLLCGHVTGPGDGQYLCTPLTVNGKAIGILHLNHAEVSGEPDAAAFSYVDHKLHIVATLTEHIALALSNLQLRETLRQQSIRDPLTGLFNRRYMEETLERELKRAVREGKPLSVIMFDIDHFKRFNDTMGHDAGDALLRELGTLLLESSRGGDIVCRYGGEEFLVVLPSTNLKDAAQHAEKLRVKTGALTVYHQGKALPKCTISLGVAAFPGNGTEGDALIKSADDALYRAKTEGRDRVVSATAPGDE